VFCLFIEIYWSVVEAMLHYNWRVLNCNFEESPISIISIICFQLKRAENGIKDSLSKALLKV
jgi:hypothetical protein